MDDDTDSVMGGRRSPDNTSITPQSTEEAMEALTDEEYQAVDDRIKNVLPNSKKKKT